MRFKVITLMVLVCEVLFAGVVAAETLDRIVANVNGEIILYSDLQNRIRILAKTTPGMNPDDPAKRPQIEQEVLQQLIQERLTEGEVKRLKIAVTDGDIDNAVKTIKQQNGLTDAQLEYVISQEGQTMAQFRDKIKRDLERNRLLDRVLKSKTVILDDQVDAYLKTGKSSSVEHRRIAVLFLKQDAGVKGSGEVEKRAREVHGRLKEGADFARLVKEYSQGPAVEQGGDIGFVKIDELAPPIEAATRGLPKNQITDVIQTPGGCYIIKVLDVRREALNASDPGAREKARRHLFQEELNRKFGEWIKELEGKAFVQVFL